MPMRTARVVSLCLLCAASVALGGCDARIDEGVLTAQADYSIDIALPYATVTPEPMAEEQAQPLVIDSEGGVTVNDSATILQGEARREDSDSSNYSSLRLGNTGLAVQALQTRLQELGYYTEGVSGVFDANTEMAVRRFEQSYGTMQTGVATVDMQARLFAQDAPVYGSEAYNNAVISQYQALQRGDVGSSVYALQQRLRNLNYPISNLTGIFDDETASAVKLFYESYGLTASEVASVAMQRELYSETARAYGSTSVSDVNQSLNVMNSSDVAQIQSRLIELGYLSGEITGEDDAATQLAIKLFEEACGQLPSGAVNTSILTLLQSGRAPGFDTLSGKYSNLIEGSSGEEVQRMQERLVELGFAMGTPNGIYGPATTASIRLFESANGLTQDGIGSAYMQAVLYSSFALNINGETVAAATAAPVVTASPTPEVPPVVPASSGPTLSPWSSLDEDSGESQPVETQEPEATSGVAGPTFDEMNGFTDGAAGTADEQPPEIWGT